MTPLSEPYRIQIILSLSLLFSEYKEFIISIIAIIVDYCKLITSPFRSFSEMETVHMVRNLLFPEKY